MVEEFLKIMGQTFEKWHIQTATARYRWLRGDNQISVTAKNPLNSKQLYFNLQHFLEQNNDPFLQKRLLLWADAFDWNTLKQSTLEYTWNMQKIRQEYASTIEEACYLTRHHKDRNVRYRAYQKRCAIASELLPHYKALIKKIKDTLYDLGYSDELAFASQRVGLPIRRVIRTLEQSTRNRYGELLSYYQNGEIDVWETNFLKNFLSAGIVGPEEQMFSSILTTINYLSPQFDCTYWHSSRLQSAVCIGIEIPHQVKILIPPGKGVIFSQSLMHEMAHALHLSSINRCEIEFRYLGSPTCPEAFAFLFQRLSGQIQDNELKQLNEFFHVLTARQLCAAAEFELSAFEDPSDLQYHYQDIYSRLLCLPAPEENDFLIETPFTQPWTLSCHAGGFWLCETLFNSLSSEPMSTWGTYFQNLMSKGHSITPREMLQDEHLHS